MPAVLPYLNSTIYFDFAALTSTLLKVACLFQGPLHPEIRCQKSVGEQYQYLLLGTKELYSHLLPVERGSTAITIAFSHSLRLAARQAEARGRSWLTVLTLDRARCAVSTRRALPHIANNSGRHNLSEIYLCPEDGHQYLTNS